MAFPPLPVEELFAPGEWSPLPTLPAFGELAQQWDAGPIVAPIPCSFPAPGARGLAWSTSGHALRIMDAEGQTHICSAHTGLPCAENSLVFGPTRPHDRSPDDRQWACIEQQQVIIDRAPDPGQLLRALAVDVPAWHRAAAEQAEQRTDWALAAFHWEQLLRRAPDESWLRLRHLWAEVRAGTWPAPGNVLASGRHWLISPVNAAPRT